MVELRGSQGRWRVLVSGVVAVALAASVGTASLASAADAPLGSVVDGEVAVPVRGGVARIDPTTLRVEYRGTRGVDTWSAPSRTELGVPSTPAVTPDGVTWRFAASDLTVVAAEKRGRLSMQLVSGSDQDVAWL